MLPIIDLFLSLIWFLNSFLLCNWWYYLLKKKLGELALGSFSQISAYTQRRSIQWRLSSGHLQCYSSIFFFNYSHCLGLLLTLSPGGSSLANSGHEVKLRSWRKLWWMFSPSPYTYVLGKRDAICRNCGAYVNPPTLVSQLMIMTI